MLLNISPISSLADFMLIISITSPNHMSAIEEHISKSLKDEGALANHRDGRKSALWRVLDYGGLIVHLMHPSAREFYQLDKLFSGARRLQWEPVVRKRPVKPVRKTPAKPRKSTPKRRPRAAAKRKTPAKRRHA